MKYATLLLLFYLLTACTGSPDDTGSNQGGSNNPPPPTEQPTPTPTPNPPHAPAHGLWQGVMEDGGELYDVTALLYQGDIIAISETAGITYSGRYSTSGGNITGSFTGYQISGGPVNSGSIAGTVVPGQTISATFAATTGDGVVELVFDERYNQPSSYALISGVWRYSEGGYDVTLTIADDGALTGQDTTGCGYSGKVTVVDEAHNLYRVAVSIEACGVMDGNYTGLGGLYDGGEMLQAVVRTSEALFLYPFARQ